MFFCVKLLLQLIFLSTLSLRRATVHYDNYNLHCVISIHALLAESDTSIAGRITSNGNFYPRSPCGERPAFDVLAVSALLISIHALLAESDGSVPAWLASSLNFYPRSPCGERRWLRCWQLAARDISIHALLAESDRLCACLVGFES